MNVSTYNNYRQSFGGSLDYHYGSTKPRSYTRYSIKRNNNAPSLSIGGSTIQQQQPQTNNNAGYQRTLLERKQVSKEQESDLWSARRVARSMRDRSEYRGGVQLYNRHTSLAAASSTEQAAVDKCLASLYLCTRNTTQEKPASAEIPEYSSSYKLGSTNSQDSLTEQDSISSTSSKTTTKYASILSDSDFLKPRITTRITTKASSSTFRNSLETDTSSESSDEDEEDESSGSSSANSQSNCQSPSVVMEQQRESTALRNSNNKKWPIYKLAYESYAYPDVGEETIKYPSENNTLSRKCTTKEDVEEESTDTEGETETESESSWALTTSYEYDSSWTTNNEVTTDEEDDTSSDVTVFDTEGELEDEDDLNSKTPVNGDFIKSGTISATSSKSRSCRSTTPPSRTVSPTLQPSEVQDEEEEEEEEEERLLGIQKLQDMKQSLLSSQKKKNDFKRELFLVDQEDAQSVSTVSGSGMDFFRKFVQRRGQNDGAVGRSTKREEEVEEDEEEGCDIQDCKDCESQFRRNILIGRLVSDSLTKKAFLESKMRCGVNKPMNNKCLVDRLSQGTQQQQTITTKAGRQIQTANKDFSTQQGLPMATNESSKCTVHQKEDDAKSCASSTVSGTGMLFLKNYLKKKGPPAVKPQITEPSPLKKDTTTLSPSSVNTNTKFNIVPIPFPPKNDFYGPAYIPDELAFPSSNTNDDDDEEGVMMDRRHSVGSTIADLLNETFDSEDSELLKLDWEDWDDHTQMQGDLNEEDFGSDLEVLSDIFSLDDNSSLQSYDFTEAGEAPPNSQLDDLQSNCSSVTELSNILANNNQGTSYHSSVSYSLNQATAYKSSFDTNQSPVSKNNAQSLVGKSKVSTAQSLVSKNNFRETCTAHSLINRSNVREACTAQSLVNKSNVREDASKAHMIVKNEKPHIISLPLLELSPPPCSDSSTGSSSTASSWLSTQGSISSSSQKSACSSDNNKEKLLTSSSSSSSAFEKESPNPKNRLANFWEKSVSANQDMQAPNFRSSCLDVNKSKFMPASPSYYDPEGHTKASEKITQFLSATRQAAEQSNCSQWSYNYDQLKRSAAFGGSSDVLLSSSRHHYPVQPLRPKRTTTGSTGSMDSVEIQYRRKFFT